MLTPRWYQEEAVLALWEYFNNKEGNPLIALPTGTGKSLVIAEFLRGALHYFPKTRAIVATHVKELVGQNAEELLTIWPTAPVGIYSAGLKRKDLGRPITFGGIATMVKAIESFGFIDFVIVDEAHLVSDKEGTMYSKFFAGLREVNPNLKVIGLTATPYRLKQGLLTDGGLFTDIAYDCTTMEKFNRLLAEGYLSPLIPRCTMGKLDTSGVHIVAGDYNLRELQGAVDKFEVTYQCCRELVEQGRHRKHWLVFASGVEHAEHITEILNDLDIPAVAIHSKMGNEARDQAIKDFKAGKYRAAVNNNVLTTGFNFKPIDLIGMFRPTQSPGLWVQMLGRGTRPIAGKENCLVLDFAGNTARLGPINDPVIPGKPGKKGAGVAPVKICEACGTYNHTSVRICVCCGTEFPKEEKLVANASTEALIAGDAPQVEIFPVTRVTYRENAREGKTPSLKVTYHCGLQQFYEWICLEHQGFAGKKARDWWRKRCEYDPPKTVKEALPFTVDFPQPYHVRIWVNRKYPEVLGYDFEGTAFTQKIQKPEFIPF